MFRQITTDFFLPRLNRGYKSYEHLIEGTIDNRQLTQLQFLAEKGFDIAKELNRWKSQAQSIDCQEIVDYLSSYPLNIQNITYNNPDLELKSIKNESDFKFEINNEFNFELQTIKNESEINNESIFNPKFSIKEENVILELDLESNVNPVKLEDIPNILDKNENESKNLDFVLKSECKTHTDKFKSNTSVDLPKITNKDKLHKQVKEKLAIRSTKNKIVTKTHIPTKKIRKIRKISKGGKLKTSVEEEFISVNFKSNVNGVSHSCKATTKQGNSCRRSVVSGSEYCWSHQKFIGDHQ